MKQEKLFKKEKERLDKGVKIADSLILESNNRLKQSIAANTRNMEGICAAQALLDAYKTDNV